MTGSLSLILYDDSGNFTYSGGIWSRSQAVQWYNGTQRFPKFATDARLGPISLNLKGGLFLSFKGTSLAFIGNSPDPGKDQTATVSVDDGAPVTISYEAPHLYHQWYKSPELSEGTHTVHVDNMDQTAMDFAVIIAGTNTPLSGKTVIVDDTDSAVVYSSGGGWRQSSAGFVAMPVPSGFPYNKSTHRSSSVGDLLCFRFTGTSVSVYGIFNWENLGILSATYTLDGKSIPQSYNVTNSTPQYVDQDLEAQNFLFYSVHGLSVGNHTLIITITECKNQEFVLDYITYTPSFSTLATMPVLSPVESGSLSSGTPYSASPTASSGSTSTSTNTSIAGSNQSRHVSIGPIVGGLVGGLLFVALLGMVLFLLWRRNQKRRLAAETPTAFTGEVPREGPSLSPVLGQAQQPRSKRADLALAWATEFSPAALPTSMSTPGALARRSSNVSPSAPPAYDRLSVQVSHPRPSD